MAYKYCVFLLKWKKSLRRADLYLSKSIFILILYILIVLIGYVYSLCNLKRGFAKVKLVISKSDVQEPKAFQSWSSLVLSYGVLSWCASNATFSREQYETWQSYMIKDITSRCWHLTQISLFIESNHFFFAFEIKCLVCISNICVCLVWLFFSSVLDL